MRDVNADLLLLRAAKRALEALDYLMPGGQLVRGAISPGEARQIAKSAGDLRMAVANYEALL